MDTVKYWLDTAEEDLITAEALFEKKRFLWMGFICNLVAEKCFKAGISKQGVVPPKIHDLGRLARLAGLHEMFSQEQSELIKTLAPLQIEARYPEYKTKIAVGLTQEICRVILKDTRELLSWTKTQLYQK